MFRPYLTDIKAFCKLDITSCHPLGTQLFTNVRSGTTARKTLENGARNAKLIKEVRLTR